MPVKGHYAIFRDVSIPKIKIFTVLFTLYKKNRKFEINSGARKEGVKAGRSIQFERLPRKKMKSIWWHVVVFAILLYVIHYLSSF